ncbi:MAG: DUF3006 domain-containing protein [Spirochaetales bacterium]|jgi:hypothetical protein|nr:DUF3006 domain-containing protein [Spirochaetales bacterium]
MKSTRLVIDRFEGMFAVCEAENHTNVSIPLTSLPEGCREGDIITKVGTRYTIDQAATAADKRRIDDKFNSLLAHRELEEESGSHLP